MSLRWLGLWAAVLVVSACTINVIVPTPTAVPPTPTPTMAPASAHDGTCLRFYSNIHRFNYR